MGGEGVAAGRQAVHGGVDARGEQGTDDQRRLLVGEFAPVGGGPDTGAEAVLAQRLPGTLAVHPGRQFGRAVGVGRDEVIRGLKALKAMVPYGRTTSMCEPGVQSGSRAPSGCASVRDTTPSATRSLAMTVSVATPRRAGGSAPHPGSASAISWAPTTLSPPVLGVGGSQAGCAAAADGREGILNQ
ncbi:hypothetical protein ACFV6E_13760 [Streptomyces sp. NPDC059785]|uniref:hypothetical protein n=1 Tax=Streptomyces sp. NPDC059785 TaxID=3346945 RepID=UPI003651FECF